MKHVLLVEDHSVFREALACLLEWKTGVDGTAQAGSLAEVRKRMRDVRDDIDVAVIDLLLPDGDGTNLIRELREARFDAPVLMLTVVQDNEVHARAKEAGADEVISKAASIQEIIGAVRRLGYG